MVYLNLNGERSCGSCSSSTGGGGLGSATVKYTPVIKTGQTVVRFRRPVWGSRPNPRLVIFVNANSLL